MLRRDALENECEAGAHIELPSRDHHGLVRLCAVSAGQMLSLLGRGSDIWELRHRNAVALQSSWNACAPNVREGS